MFFHGKDRKSLLKHINAANLPANYGGDAPMIDYSSKDWYDTLNYHADFIARWNTFGFANSNWNHCTSLIIQTLASLDCQQSSIVFWILRAIWVTCKGTGTISDDKKSIHSKATQKEQNAQTSLNQKNTIFSKRMKISNEHMRNELKFTDYTKYIVY